MRLPAVELDSSLSPFTGRSLRHADTNVEVVPHQVDMVKRLIESSPIADSDGTLWSGQLTVESFQDDGPHSLTITWEETEEVRADVVEFEGLSLQPTKYEEHENGDGSIAVSFQAVLTAEETEKLRALMPSKRSSVLYWPVIRRGVSDEPRQMRLGRVLWQQLPDGTIGHDITLADEAFDQSDGSAPFLGIAGEPMVSTLVVRVSDLLVQFQALIAELEATGALPTEALERIRASAESLGPAQRHAFYEVADLSKW